MANVNSAEQLAALAWLIAGAYQFTALPELSYLSWQALAYFTVGTLGAAVLFGRADSLMTRGVAKVMVRFPLSSDPEIETKRLRVVGWLLVPLLFMIVTLAGATVAAGLPELFFLVGGFLLAP